MSFDALAPLYSPMEWFLAGSKLQRCRTAFLSQARGARSVLLAGEGHGRFLAELCRINPAARICCVDSSAGMTRIARSRLSEPDRARVEFHTVPIFAFRPEKQFDLVATHFFLDCFEPPELGAVIHELASSLGPGGRWIVSDFQVPRRGWRKCRARIVLALAYRFFRVATGLPARKLADPAPFLAVNQLTRKETVTFNFELLYAALWEKSA
jgi:ubiquinone/menaquinone biosynthesis C-methylase UbiE